MCNWKNRKMNINLFSFISVCLGLSLCDTYPANRFTFKVTRDGRERVFHGLKEYNFTEVSKITPTTSIFEYRGNIQPSRVLREVKRIYQNEILACEPVKVYRGTLKPVEVPTNMEDDSSDYENKGSNLVCNDYYGFNTSEVWIKGITGKGVTVGVTDVGINTNLIDLEGNIVSYLVTLRKKGTFEKIANNNELCRNFVTGSDNVSPEKFHNFKDKAPHFTDHGNRVASVVAATKANNFCSAGIAYNASIVALKIFNVTLDKYGFFATQTSSDITANALGYHRDKLDILVNAWGPTQLFGELDLAITEALKYGANWGRRGHGTIYLVPSGPAGNDLSNNIHTITVAGMGQFGTIPQHVHIDASVITSGLWEGNALSSVSMVTTSHNDKCIDSFKGVSAATAQIAGIIALGLQANPLLSKRDVVHLLVRASDHSGLEETKSFSRNAAGIYFHDKLGAGLLNALEFVTGAEQHKPLPKLLSKKLACTHSSHHQHIQLFEFCYSCDELSNSSCLTTIEHVEVTFHLKTNTNYLRMELISPHHTHSVLVNHTLLEGLEIMMLEIDIFIPMSHISATRKLKSERKELSSTQKRKLISVRFWDEAAFGKWKFKLENHEDISETLVRKISLKLYGTKRDISKNFFSNIEACRKAHTEPATSGNTTPSKVQETNVRHSANKTIHILIPFAIIIAICLIIFALKKGSIHGIPISRSEVSLLPQGQRVTRFEQQNDTFENTLIERQDA